MKTIWQSITQNWKTSLMGLCSFLAGVPGFINALTAWGSHQPVNWRDVIVSMALSAIGVGLASAKDGTTHSTAAQVQLSSLQNPVAQAEAIVAAKAEAKAEPSGVPIELPVPISVPKTPEVKK